MCAGPNQHGADANPRPLPAPEWTPVAAAPRRAASPRLQRMPSPRGSSAAAEVGTLGLICFGLLQPARLYFQCASSCAGQRKPGSALLGKSWLTSCHPLLQCPCPHLVATPWQGVFRSCNPFAAPKVLATQALAAPWGRAAAAAALPAELAVSLDRLTLDTRADAAGALPFPTARTAAPLSARKGGSEYHQRSAGTQPGAPSSVPGAPALASANPCAQYAPDMERTADAAAGGDALPWAPQAPCPDRDPSLNPVACSSSPARLRSGEGYKVSLRHTRAGAVLAAQGGPLERGVCSAADVFGPLTAAEQAQLALVQGPSPSAGHLHAPGALVGAERALQAPMRDPSPGGGGMHADKALGMRALPHGPGTHDGVQLDAGIVAGEGARVLRPRGDDGAAQPERTQQAAPLPGSLIRDHEGAGGIYAERAEPVPQAAALAGGPVRDQQGTAGPGSSAGSCGADAQAAPGAAPDPAGAAPASALDACMDAHAGPCAAAVRARGAQQPGCGLLGSSCSAGPGGGELGPCMALLERLDEQQPEAPPQAAGGGRASGSPDPGTDPTRAAGAAPMGSDMRGPAPGELGPDAAHAAGSAAAEGCPGLSPCPDGAAGAGMVDGRGRPRSDNGGGSGSCTPSQGTSIAGQAMVRGKSAAVCK